MGGFRALLIVRGRVQGVGFRWFVVKRARALGVTGWVRNRPDGAVEAEGEGDRDTLERWIAAVREGPPGARVDDLDAEFREGGPRHDGFEVSR